MRARGHARLRRRVRELERELRSLEGIEGALARWAVEDRLDPPPTPFTAFDISILDGELRIRLATARAELEGERAA